MKNERTDEQKDKTYIPLCINAGGGVSDVWYVYDTSSNDILSNKPFHVLKVLLSNF